MKKNVFSRTLAVLASTAVLGAASMMSANAAGEVFTINSVEALPGQTVQLTVSASAGNCLESLDGEFGYDPALTASAAKGIGDFSAASEVNAANNTVSLAGMTLLADGISDGEIVTLEFAVPEDAEVGTVYDITWASVSVAATIEAGDVTATATYNPGTITVVAPETEPTTEAPTEAPATEAPTTTTKKAPTTGAPKTGTAGVAVAVAGLVTAGATAVVLKKRH